MSLIPPEIVSALYALGGAAVRELAAALARSIHRRRLRPMQEVDEMADSARFAAIEEAVGKLSMQLDATRVDADRRIAELTADLQRATQSSARLSYAVTHLYDELQALRRDTGLPPLPPLDTYLQEERTDATGDTDDARRHSAGGDRSHGAYPRALPPPRIRPPR